MSACAIGSSRGYDELIPKTLSVVTERRLYHDYYSGDVVAATNGSIFEKVSPAVSSGVIAPPDRDVLVTAGGNSPNNCDTAKQSLKLENSGSGCSSSTEASTVSSPAEVILETAMYPESSRMAVRGSWDGWQGDIPMQRSPQSNKWSALFPAAFLPPREAGHHPRAYFQYKFISEGSSWFYDQRLPWSCDSSGNINNELIIAGPEDHTTEDGKAATRNHPGSGGCSRRVFSEARLWRPGQSLPGIMQARIILNAVHQRLSTEGFVECECSIIADNVVAVTRHDPSTHRFCLCLAHCAFWPSVVARGVHSTEAYVELKGRIAEVILEARLEVPDESCFEDEQAYINGLGSYLTWAEMTKVGTNTMPVTPISRLNLFNVFYDKDTSTSRVELAAFGPGSVVIMMTAGLQHVVETVRNAVHDLSSITQDTAPVPRVERAEIMQALSYLLFSSGPEERDRSKGARGCYELKGSIGELPYAGLCGMIPLLDTCRYLQARRQDTSNHPLIKNLMSGDWMFEYIADRIDSDRDNSFSSSGVIVILLKFASWFRETFREPLRCLPRQLVPYYFDWITSVTYSWAVTKIAGCVVEPLRSCLDDPFLLRLITATLQMYSYVPSAPLVAGTTQPSLAAGLPFFATSYMRCWGRDTFIAFRGCLLAVGRYVEARAELLGFASVCRHGLIPNLLDGGVKPRFNARDATWYFLQSIQDYCMMAPEGVEFLLAPLELRFGDRLPAGCTIENVADLVHLILSCHAQGISFREDNAGTSLDEHMTSSGFDVHIRFDSTNGILYGGNRHNCGTWMDKMGSSDEAKNRGIPATSRDGAAVEITGLLKSVMRFVTSLPKTVFKFEVVNPTTGLTYKQWDALLRDSFELEYYIPSAADDDPRAEQRKISSSLVNRTGIYRDCLQTTDEWCAYQLRCNFPLALAVAPELVTKSHALESLEVVARILLSSKSPEAMQTLLDCLRAEDECKAATSHKAALDSSLRRLFPFGFLFTNSLGMKTLDPTDYSYRPVYNNGDQSTDFATAHGFNYHNGPEWVWPLGYFLEALYRFAQLPELVCRDQWGAISRAEASKFARWYTMRFLLGHRHYMESDMWLSLPELTNAERWYCSFSCQAQAWSVGTVLAFLLTVAQSSS